MGDGRKAGELPTKVVVVSDGDGDGDQSAEVIDSIWDATPFSIEIERATVDTRCVVGWLRRKRYVEEVLKHYETAAVIVCCWSRPRTMTTHGMFTEAFDQSSAVMVLVGDWWSVFAANSIEDRVHECGSSYEQILAYGPVIVAAVAKVRVENAKRMARRRVGQAIRDHEREKIRKVWDEMHNGVGEIGTAPSFGTSNGNWDVDFTGDIVGDILRMQDAAMPPEAFGPTFLPILSEHRAVIKPRPSYVVPIGVHHGEPPTAEPIGVAAGPSITVPLAVANMTVVAVPNFDVIANCAKALRNAIDEAEYQEDVERHGREYGRDAAARLPAWGELPEHVRQAYAAMC